MSLEDSLRSIVREELERVLRAPDGVAAPPPLWLTMTALAKHWGVAPSTIKSMVKRGLPYIQPDQFKRFNVAECELWLRDQRRAEAAE